MKKIGQLLAASCVVLFMSTAPALAEEKTQDSTTTTEMSDKVATELLVNKNVALTNMPKDHTFQVDTEGTFKWNKLDLSKFDVTFSGQFKLESSDEKVLSVDKEGKWKALKEGKVTLTFGYQLDDKVKAALEAKGYKVIETLQKVEVTIKKTTPTAPAKVQSEGMTININKIVVKGETGQLNPVVKEAKTNSKDETKEPKTDAKEERAAVKDEASQSKKYEFVYKFNPDDIDIDAKTGKWTAKKAGVTVIQYGYIVKEDAEKAKDARTTETAKEQKELEGTWGTMAIAIQESQSETFPIRHGMTVNGPDLTKLKVGDTGKLNIAVDLVKGTPFKGTYQFDQTNGIIDIDAQGNYKAVKPGETHVSFTYKMDPAILKEWVKTSDFEDFATKLQNAILPVLDVKVAEAAPVPADKIPLLHNGMTILLPDTITVGETYKFKINMDDNMKFDGEYKFIYDTELFDIALNGSEGTLTAKKTGKIAFQYGYLPSEAMYAELVKANGGNALKDDPGIYNMDVQPVQKPAPIKKPNPLQKLPQTGEQKRQWLMVAGVILIVVVIIVVIFMKRKNKEDNEE